MTKNEPKIIQENKQLTFKLAEDQNQSPGGVL